MSAPAARRRRPRQRFDWPVAIGSFAALYGFALLGRFAWPTDPELAAGLVLGGFGLVVLLALGARR